MMIEENNLLDAYETGYYSTPDARGEFHPSLVYNAVTTDQSSNTARLSTIPAGKYLCICFNANDPLPQITKLNEYLKQNKVQPSLILQVNLLNEVFETETQYCETQVLL